jgi:putative FmdB family regulatory protein
MPIYEYQCGDCELRFEQQLPITRHAEPQDCPECGVPGADKLVSAVGFILRGDGWAGKNGRVKKQMAEKNRGLESRSEEMRRDAPGMTLAPNVGGERTDSWVEAKQLAASKGKDTSGYDSYIHKEKVGGSS